MERDEEFYNRLYTRRRYSRRNRGVWRTVLSEFLTEPSKILDVGCGDGMFGKLCIKGGHSYIGVDVSGVAIVNARELTPEGCFFHIDVNKDKVLVEQGDYDVIVFLEVLEHLSQDLELVKSIPSDKRVIFSVPDFWSKDHVRIFKTERDIEERYSDLLQIERIIKLPKRRRHKFVVTARRR